MGCLVLGTLPTLEHHEEPDPEAPVMVKTLSYIFPWSLKIDYIPKGCPEAMK